MLVVIPGRELATKLTPCVNFALSERARNL